MFRDALRPAAWVVLAILAAYVPAWWGVFQFDDYNVIVDAAQVHSLDAWLAALGHGLRPLLKLTYLLNWQVEPQPRGFHAFNLLVHLATTGMVYLLARHFGQLHRPDHDWRPVALLTAACFALHPAHTEAITYVSGRATSLMTLAYLFALYAYARGWQAWALLAFALAVLVKESAMLLPVTLLAWETLTGGSPRRIVQRQWPWWLLVALAVAALLAHPGYRSLVGNSLQVREPASAMLTQLHAVAWLLGQWAWPVALNIDPDLPQISAPIDVWPELLGLLLAGVLAWQCRRQRPWISLGIVWAALHLLLFNAVFPRDDIANERLLYWGDWALIFAVATELQLRVPLRALRVAGVTLACVLALATAQRNHVYRSEVALWEDTARKSPHKARVLNNLGHAYGENGQPADAERAYRAALRIDPDYTKAINNLERLHQAAADAAPD